MRLHRIAAVASLVSLSACATGKNAADLGIAHSPQGATYKLTMVDKSKLEGELIEVRDDGVVMFLRDGRVALVTYPRIAQAVAPELDHRYMFGLRMPPSREARPYIVLVSHYPQGMTPEIQAKLLASKGQKELVVLR